MQAGIISAEWLRGMKLKNRRLIFSLLFGCLFLAGSVLAFKKIQHGPQDAGAPKILRNAFLWNEKVWSILKSSKRLSVKKPRPPVGKEPRINGDLGLISSMDIKNFQVHVESGNNQIFLPVSAFKLIPKTEYSTDFRCIEGWSEELHYAGARFSDFMNYYNVGKKADGDYYSYVGLETPDGKYYVSIDMESMLHEQTLIAWEMNGSPLSVPNGAPIRLIIPIKYGIKSLKRIGRIFFSDQRPPDYWAERGYDWYSGL